MNDLRFAVRQLLKSPGYTAVAVLTLALGIGLNTSMFSLVNTLLLRPLPFPHPEALVRLHRATPQGGNEGFSPGDYLALKRAEPAFGTFAAYANDDVSLSAPGQPAEPHRGKRVSADYLDVLGIVPELGRGFRAEDEVDGGQHVVMLSHALWQSRFDGDRNVIGRSVRVDGEPHEVIGVLPAWAGDGRVIRHIGLFRPLRFSGEQRHSDDGSWVDVIGRRGDGVSLTQGRAFLASLGARREAERSGTQGENRWRMEGLRDSTVNPTGRGVLAMLLVLSGFVLLIACSNLANVLLARTMARANELGVRAALGASRLQLLRSLGFEALILALAGGTGALFVGVWASAWLSARSASGGGTPISLPLDWRVLGFALLASLLTASVFGLLPAAFAMRVDVIETLKRGARGSTAGSGHRRLRQALIVGQLAMAMTLVAGTGYLVRGASALVAQRAGWQDDQQVVGVVRLPASRYPGAEEITAFHRRMTAELERLPGVEAASVSATLPAYGFGGPRRYVVENADPSGDGGGVDAGVNAVSPEYFMVTGARLLRGRAFEATDTATSAKVAIVDETMARRLFPDGALGRRIAVAGADAPDWIEIVGVAEDVRSLDAYEHRVPFQVYRPFAQDPPRYANLAVRVTGILPASALEPIRARIASLDPDLPVRDLMPITARLERMGGDILLLQQILGAFALLGLALAALGIYGVVARSVRRRTAEIGIRIALGARVADVVAPVLGSGLWLALAGTVIGSLAAFGLSRVLGSIMPALPLGVAPVLAVAGGVLVTVALCACWLPARAAARIDPIVALRVE